MASAKQNASEKKALDPLTQITEIRATLEAALRAEVEREKQTEVLESVSLGLYEELDKLSKKAPSEPVTGLVLSEMNQVIGDVKQVASDDPYIKRLNIFVAAGDNPEHRDAVVVARLLRQGLERLRTRLKSRDERIAMLLKEARTIEAALHLKKAGEDATVSALHEYVMEVAARWIDSRGRFKFDLLSHTNLPTHFSLSE